MKGITIEKDARKAFGPTRDQGDRPTCLAFAASDAHAARRGPWAPLSAEFLFFHSLRRSGGSPDRGSSFEILFEALRADGQPLEVGWPYLPALPVDRSKWQPPVAVGEVYRRHSDNLAATFQTVWDLLDGREAVVIGMSLSPAFYQGAEVVDASEPVEPGNRHALVAVASGTRHRERYILVRNSWGNDWGREGHAWLAELYLTPRLIRVARITEAA